MTRRFRRVSAKRRARMRTSQRQRALIVLVVLLAGLVGLRHFARRSSVPGVGSATTTDATWMAPTLETGERSRLLEQARARLIERAGTGEPPTPTRGRGGVIAIASLSRADGPAWTRRGHGPGTLDAVSAAIDGIARAISPEDARRGILKIDLVTDVGPMSAFDDQARAVLDPSVEGVWLTDHDLILLPEEQMARRLFDNDGDLQSGRLRRYLEAGGHGRAAPEDNPGAPGAPYRVVRFDSFAEGADGLPIRLFRGNDRAPSTAPDALLQAARLGGDYLVRQLRDDGSFVYIYKPTRDREGEDYNFLRHAGSCYALLELFRVTDDARYRDAAQRGIEYLLTHARPPKPADAAAAFEAIVSPGEEAKLGGAALAILAILEHHDATGERRWLERAEGLARFIQFMQDDTGRFESKYFYGRPDAKPFVSIYYPGEAILALTRLARVTGNTTWLNVARRGADYLITVRDASLETAELPHDHWLLMGLDELDRVTDEPLYPRHAARIGEAILNAQRRESANPDWIGTFYDPPRSTPTATRAEALVALHRLTTRHGESTRAIESALMLMAAFQLRCQLNETNSHFLPRPDRAHGGFRRSLTNFEIRIDYVQHNMSALLGLRERLSRSRS